MAPVRHRRNNATTVVLLLSVVAGMVGLSFASVPLYSLFCRATGWGGTTQRASAAPKEAADALVTVRFDAETAPDLGWEFRPLTPQIRVRPGEPTEVFFRAINRGSEPVTGTAAYNVTPTKSGIYFDKLQCFCFTEQRLGPGESRDMGVQFFVDPELLKDPSTRDVNTITLSYTMFRKPDAPAPRPVAGAAGSAASVTRAATPTATPTVN
jgi:cytochrome c oxidase assembly protein subunit 11